MRVGAGTGSTELRCKMESFGEEKKKKKSMFMFTQRGGRAVCFFQDLFLE